MSEWKTYKLYELVDTKRGITYGVVQPGEFLKVGGIPILKVNNLTERKYNVEDAFRISNEVESKYERSRLIGNEILVSLVGSLGYIYKVRKELIGWNVVRAIGVLPIKDEFDKEWIYWFLKSPDIQRKFQSQANTTVQATLNLKELREIEITYPDLKTRNIITSILTSLDDKIELNLQMNQTLEAMAQALFKEWFVNFNFPNFDGELQNDLPKGWRMGKVKEMYKTTSGGTPSRAKEEYYENGTIDWVKSKELNGSFIFDTEEKITVDAVKNSSAKLIPKHSVLLAMYGATVGEYAITTRDTTCNQAICAVIEDGTYPFTYFFEYFKINKNNIIGQASGSAQQNISQALIQQLDILIPPIEVVKKYHSVVESMFIKMENNLLQIQSLTQTRDTLLPKLMSGKLEIKE